jgi:hypothetical protein
MTMDQVRLGTLPTNLCFGEFIFYLCDMRLGQGSANVLQIHGLVDLYLESVTLSQVR